MSALSLLLNLLWIVFGGLMMAVGWLIAAVLMAITIIGLPWTRAAFNIAVYTLLPFGQKAVSRAEYYGSEDVGTGPLGFLGNIVWLVLAGWWLALGHLVTAILLAVTIIGIPFAWAHLKLAGIALWPIGKMIVPAEDAPLAIPTLHPHMIYPDPMNATNIRDGSFATDPFRASPDQSPLLPPKAENQGMLVLSSNYHPS